MASEKNLSAASTRDNSEVAILAFDFIEDEPEERDDTDWQDFLELHARVRS